MQPWSDGSRGLLEDESIRTMFHTDCEYMCILIFPVALALLLRCTDARRSTHASSSDGAMIAHVRGMLEELIRKGDLLLTVLTVSVTEFSSRRSLNMVHALSSRAHGFVKAKPGCERHRHQDNAYHESIGTAYFAPRLACGGDLRLPGVFICFIETLRNCYRFNSSPTSNY